MPFLRSIEENAHPSSILKKFPESGRLIMQFTEQLTRGPASLTTAVRELIGERLANEGYSSALDHND